MNNIAENKLCSGCGVCSAVCPKECIKIKENPLGELRPTADENLCISCGKCKKVCSFNNNSVIPENFGKCFIGCAPDYKDNGSSGGVATFFLSNLLKENAADYVVSVKPNDNSDELFCYTVCKEEKDLISCQGSAYYPVTLSKILKDLKNLDGTVAVIGVPCFITALKNLKCESKFWNEKIKFLVGIVCGHTPSKHLVDALAFKSGHKRENITSIRFRIKDDNKPAWDYGVKLSFDDGSFVKSFGSDDFGFLFWRKFFSQECCNNCKDVFADNADITFMDAWLDEYKNEREGTSLLICRNKELLKILNPLIENGNIKEVENSKLVTAQKDLVEYKKNAGCHKVEENRRKEAAKVFEKYCERPEIIDQIRRINYKENLKRKNFFLWCIICLKDRLTK